MSDEISVTFDNTPTDVDGFDDPFGITLDNYADAEFNEYAPVTIDLVGTTDTGLDTTDNITFQTTPSFRIKNLTATDSIFLSMQLWLLGRILIWLLRI